MMQAFERDLLPKAFDQEAKLDATLQRVAAQRSRLGNLERLSDDIARWQAAFAATLGRCDELAATLNVNAANLERLLADPVFAGRTALDTLLVAPLRLGTSQMTADLNYLRITQTQADQTQRSIGIMAQVRSARWSRRTTMLLGAFAVFGSVRVFPELPLSWRIGLSVLLVPSVLLALWLLARRE
jgi:hypothetical protein